MHPIKEREISGRHQMRISVKKLTHHPLNEKIYSISSIDDLTESIAKVGLLENLVINQNNQIISGNRRFSAIKKLGWKTVSCDRIEIAKKDTPQILIHYNKQRIKTCRELLNEIKILVPQYQIGQGKRTDLTSVTENRSGRTRDKVGESLGISGSQIAKLLYIEKINPSLIDLIDVGELTVSQGYFQCRKLNEKPKRKLNRPSSNDFVDFPYSIVNGDCQEVMSRMEENSIQTCVTDPPYGMNFAEWDKKVPSIDIWKEIYRVLMPGAFCLGDHGCDMHRSLNIPITDKFVWDTVMDTVSQSSTLKEGFKEEILHSKYAGDAETNRELKNLKTKSNRLKKDLQQVHSSIADVETNNLLKRYDAEVYSKIKSNLDTELKTKKDEIEQTRIRIKELGNHKRWLD
jgi:hypothetical protein